MGFIYFLKILKQERKNIKKQSFFYLQYSIFSTLKTCIKIDFWIWQNWSDFEFQNPFSSLANCFCQQNQAWHFGWKKARLVQETFLKVFFLFHPNFPAGKNMFNFSFPRTARSRDEPGLDPAPTEPPGVPLPASQPPGAGRAVLHKVTALMAGSWQQ